MYRPRCIFHKALVMERDFWIKTAEIYIYIYIYNKCVWCDVHRHKADCWQSSVFQPKCWSHSRSIKDNSQAALGSLASRTFQPLSRWGLKSDGAIGFKNKAGRIYASEVLKCLAGNWVLNRMGRLSTPKVVEKDILLSCCVSMHFLTLPLPYEASAAVRVLFLS